MPGKQVELGGRIGGDGNFTNLYVRTAHAKAPWATLQIIRAVTGLSTRCELGQLAVREQAFEDEDEKEDEDEGAAFSCRQLRCF